MYQYDYKGKIQSKKSKVKAKSFSLDDVKMHYHSNKSAQLQTLAYTQGRQVYIGSGQEKYLGHKWGQSELMQFAQTSNVAENSSLENGVIQRELNQSTPRGNLANPTLTLRQLNEYINKYSSKTVKDIVNHTNTNINIFWDDTIVGAAATTTMEFNGGGHRIDLFAPTPVQVNAIGMLDSATPYHILINITLETALPGGPLPVTTWEGNLLHELEAHTKLAGKIINNFKSPNKAKLIRSSIEARTEQAEHYAYAISGGTSTVMETAIKAAPLARKFLVFLDMLRDRLDQIQIATNPITPGRVTPQRVHHNGEIQAIIKWAERISEREFTLTALQRAQIDQIIQALIAQKIH